MLNARFSTMILLIVATMTVATAVVTYGVIFGSKTINNAGNVNIIGVGVYWEASCTNEVSTINWSYVEPGSTQDTTIYIRNEGTITMTMNMTTSNWSSPQASAYITLNWNREGSQVNPNAVLETVLTLTVSPYVTEMSGFSFDITITGIQ